MNPPTPVGESPVIPPAGPGSPIGPTNPLFDRRYCCPRCGVNLRNGDNRSDGPTLRECPMCGTEPTPVEEVELP